MADLPDLLAKMTCIYYFDMPVRYGVLTRAYPRTIDIKPISDLPAGIEAFGAR